MTEKYHVPVMLSEAVEYLVTVLDGEYVDCTLGDGGHTQAILEKLNDEGKVVAYDRDPAAISTAEVRLEKWRGRIQFVNAPFSKMKETVQSCTVSGVLFDLGVSTKQLIDYRRGFSFMGTGPLDMRMGIGSVVTAGDIVNSYQYDELVKIFRDYGEERYSNKYAHKIVEVRKNKRIETTSELVSILAGGYQGKHPATRVFQALRIAVNNELEELNAGLITAVDSLKQGGRIVVISYHSLEDRIVKNMFKSYKNDGVLSVLTKKPLIPSEDEVRINRSSRSAKMRVAEKR
ncbi:MAG: 16S rRNA (cytosine(1402)-N(4))-methyltransferase RsmH [Elusimicrobiota bacterium]